MSTIASPKIIGPTDGESVSLGGPRQRAVLARLALVSGHVVTVDRLVDDVWAGDPPATAAATVRVAAISSAHATTNRVLRCRRRCGERLIGAG